MTEETPPTDPGTDEKFLDTVLEQFRLRTEDFCIVTSPLPDGLGWRTALMIADGQIVASVAGHRIASQSAVLAIGRGETTIDEAMSESRSDQGEGLTGV